MASDIWRPDLHAYEITYSLKVAIFTDYIYAPDKDSALATFYKNPVNRSYDFRFLSIKHHSDCGCDGNHHD